MKQFTQENIDKKIRQRNFLLMLPIIILPFLTFLFWSLGLVGASDVKASAGGTKGLNMQLPDARLKENKSWNKLSFYEQADRDSARYREAMKNDPYYHMDVRDSLSALIVKPNTTSAYNYNPMPSGYMDSNEYKVNKKLAELNVALNKSNDDDKSIANHNTAIQVTPGIQSNDVDRLEKMLQVINQPDSTMDPETKQLNTMMDKILAIQHPESVKESVHEETEKNKKGVYQAIAKPNDAITTVLQGVKEGVKPNSKRTNQPVQKNGFYSLYTDSVNEEKHNSIEAEIQETQTLVSGATIKLCLLHDVYVNGNHLLQGTYVYGLTTLNEERLHVTITNIRYHDNLFPIALSAYDLDGVEGIYIPGTLQRDVVKQSSSDAVNSIGITSLDPSIGAQAANAGIQAAKSLISKKVKQMKVTVKAGYKVLLKDGNQNQ
jgi:conjugative transposon TraM protein